MYAKSYATGAPAAAPLARINEKQDYLVFRLGDGEYGIRLENVQELCSFDKVAQFSGAPESIAGTLSLRSQRIPVVDMHAVMRNGNADKGRLTDVIVLCDGDKQCGLAVDCVIDVVTLAEAQITGTAVPGSPCRVGAASIGQRSMILLDADKLMSDLRPGPAERLAA
ncbi:chemotaxis protein CheW [Noviherbaspirillum sp.]|uniref:chemotaxis protein CheW n=1 Tax=Noviherbaspirillum sp. TaxID=1926288 RepID=UPI002B4A2AAF|nr:chemotaxis protein CheW [Noviherbaspirillum sp.]HJV81288.1 chemotaxis protein CheW [Noviherbaspirillum sp.]